MATGISNPMHYASLAISYPAELIFGQALYPVTTRSGMVIGGGTVFPELNFTLPPVSIAAETLSEVRCNYEQIIQGATRHAVELLRDAYYEGNLRVSANETAWFDRMQDTLDELPESENDSIGEQLHLADHTRFLPEEYGL